MWFERDRGPGLQELVSADGTRGMRFTVTIAATVPAGAVEEIASRGRLGIVQTQVPVDLKVTRSVCESFKFEAVRHKMSRWLYTSRGRW